METAGRRTKAFLDSNVLLSAFLFPEGHTRQAIELMIEKDYNLVTSEYVIFEVQRVLENRFPSVADKLGEFLSMLDAKIVRTPGKGFCLRYAKLLRDVTDLPILAAAIKEKADLLLSGDKDFHTPEVSRLITVLSPGEFLNPERKRV